MIGRQEPRDGQARAPQGGRPERRGHFRIRTLGRVAAVRSPSDAGLCHVWDISNGGIMIESRLDFRLGGRVEIMLSEDNALEGQAIWHQQGRAGIRFHKPIDCCRLIRELAANHWRGHSRPPRLPIDRSVLVRSELGSREVKLKDISQRGVKVERSDHCAPGLSVKLVLEDGMEVSGTVRWSENDHTGIELSRIIPVDRLGSIGRLRNRWDSSD